MLCLGSRLRDAGGKQFLLGESAMYRSAMHWVIRIVLLLALAWAACETALGQQASPPPASPSPAPSPEPTPITLANMPADSQSAMAALQEIDASVSRVKSATADISTRLFYLTSEIEPRMAEDTKLLQARPSLDMLYRIKLTWQDFGENLSALSRELVQRATGLDEELGRLNQLNKAWEVTLQDARKSNVPPAALQSVQSLVDSIDQTRQNVEAGRAEALTLLSQISDEATRVRRTLSLVEQSQIEALKGLLVRDSPFLWNLKTGLGREWGRRSGESFSSQLKASTAFSKRLPFSFLVHGSLIVVIAITLQWMRRGVKKLAKEKPDLERALPILDLPISTAFVLTVLFSPAIYPQAPRLIQAVLGTLALIPAVAILRGLLDRNWSPILYAIVILYFTDQLRVLAASLPELARFLFLGQMLGASLFLFWLLKSRDQRTTAAKTSARLTRAIRVIAGIGVIFLPAALLANVFGYVDLGNLLGMIFLRSIYAGALLYTAVRILEGLIIIALEIRPLNALRVVSLHRSMLQQRTGRVLEVLAFLFWLNLILSFFGLLAPLIATVQAALNASLTIGSLSISLGGVLAFAIAIWASFLVSRFLRFILEEDIYHYFFLDRGIPYAISTMLHYAILLIGFFLALGALGIDLTKITILAGAFSVGIGFGLQNVINNFVSGLILLFERPIKIGDIIEVSGNVGEVQHIGIRASIIRTTDGSEVIVPNGMLISTQVTNWTLSDRGRAVEVSVSVVGRENLQRATDLLKSLAAEHPDVTKEPAPEVQVLNLTASAITLKLRVWTDRNEAWAQLRSDLSLAINETLAREKIAIA
jgi:potassium-dependent mechanosensitive channel